ncbi:hypothetical protein [Ruminococcus sp. FC2018]|uniref:hypothetical protein n=1 Tax=Ruminococcus sp. FC2018 TaxID=1410617 RepID=UPI000490560A|nr:hypothetical protein [Ruminococcus sp. FC2018]
MGFFDKVKDFLDDGKINGSNAKPNEEQQTAENAQPEHSGAAEAAAKNDPFASMTPQERETLRRAQEIADQQKAIREAAGIKEPERMSKEERNVMKDEIVELPFSIDCSIMPYQDTNGNNVCVKMFGKVTAKALYDPSNKEILALTVKSAPQQAYFDILMRQQVPADQLQNCIMELKQKMADVLKNARDFEIQSIDITSISG